MEMQKTINKKNLALMVIIFGFILITSQIVSAEFWSCFNEGEDIVYCNDYRPSDTCDEESGCKYCMSVYRAEDDCYVHGVWNKCNFIPQECSNIGGSVDTTPTNITINSPINDSIHTESRLRIDVETTRRVKDISYLDLINGRGRWSKLCDSCDSFNNTVYFKDGHNEVLLRSTDFSGAETFGSLNFFIDTKDPRITQAEPRSGFSNGEFYVEFKEDNPQSLTLYYGNDSIRSKQVSLEDDCIFGERESECQVNVDIVDFDGKNIVYWFELTDIAGNTDLSREQVLSVDVSSPVIENFVYTLDKNKVYFSLDVFEINFESVSYIDELDERGRERPICRRLDGTLCEGKISLKDGDHNLKISARDEAGNQEVIELNFFTDSKDPRISKTEPRRGFSNGEFYVEFKEDNPQSLTLYYGNENLTKIHEININERCVLDRSYSCQDIVDLQDFDGQEITYWVVLEDKVSNIDTSRENKIMVDLTAPIINNDDVFSTEGYYVFFNLNITEDNFEEVNYNYIDSRGNERQVRLCSRLNDYTDSTGVCETRKNFRQGNYSLSLEVLDEAGNKVNKEMSFEIL